MPTRQTNGEGRVRRGRKAARALAAIRRGRGHGTWERQDRRIFRGAHEDLAAQLVRIVEAFLNSDRLDIPSLFHSDPLRRRILIALNIDLVVQHVLRNVTEQDTERLTPVFDKENPIGASGLMRIWYTIKPCFPTTKSHISHLVGESAWEGHAANDFGKRVDNFS